MSSNEQPDHEAETSETEADALTQMALAGIQLFLDGVNEVLAEEQQYGEGGYSDHGRGSSDSFETSEDLAAYINGFKSSFLNFFLSFSLVLLDRKHF